MQLMIKLTQLSYELNGIFGESDIWVNKYSISTLKDSPAVPGACLIILETGDHVLAKESAASIVEMMK